MARVVPNMTEQEYRAYPAVNKSTLWEMRKSPAHYKWALEHPAEDTPAFAFGRALHMAVLQPDQFGEHYRMAPIVDRRTKAGREEYDGFIASLHEGQEPLSAEDAQTIVAMMGAVSANPYANDLLSGAKTEVPIIWTDEMTGLECKCRLDAIRESTDDTIPGLTRLRLDVTDLKTCADASTNAFLRDALRYGYDVQAAHYVRGVKALYGDAAVIRWHFVAIEKKAPFAVNEIEAGDDFLDRGTWQLIDLMDRLKECRETDTWPDYGHTKLILPAWADMPDEDE